MNLSQDGLGGVGVSELQPDALGRLRLHGPQALTDVELVAVSLQNVGPEGLSAAQALLADFGGLAALLDADFARLAAVGGLGPGEIAALRAVRALAERGNRQAVAAAEVFSASDAVLRYLRQHLAGREREQFACLFLDTRHRLIQFETLFYGSVDRANVYPREILKRSLWHNAAAVIFAHNHPSGVAEPSASDIRLTEELKGLLKLVDVRVLDHVIVGSGREVSLAERGLLGG